MSHLEQHSALSPLQHGFRSGYSCESQLLLTFHDLASNYDNKIQTDVVILDFSKAFDTMPHSRLLMKLDRYRVRGCTLKWIGDFLQRRQQVVVEISFSTSVVVDSGVPQGSVLGPLLFLCYINDLPHSVQSQVRLFADDCLIYRPIHSIADQTQLQRDLTDLQKLSETWGMRFNTKHVSRSRSQLNFSYSLCEQVLQCKEDNTYLGLGVQLSKDLTWSTRINCITNKASRTLGFLWRNLRGCPKRLSKLEQTGLLQCHLGSLSSKRHCETSSCTAACSTFCRK